jgi:tetratricopeptide (TPR) repeat protein
LWALLLLVTVIYFGLRAVVLGTAIAPAAFGTPLERVLSLPIIFAKYIGSLFSLLPIDPHHPDGFVSTFTDPRLWIGSVICLLYAGLIYRAARSGLKTFVFFLLWIPVTLAQTFKLGSFGDVLRADRFLYLPSAGFALLAALAGKYFIADRVEPGSLPRRLCAASLLVIVGAWITLSIAHGRIWRNNVSLFSHASRTSPDSAYIVFNLGNSRFETGNFKGASDAYARAIRLDPTYREAYANRGIALARMGLFREALDHYRKAWELGDHSALLLSSTADLYRQLGDVERAVTWYELSLAAAPTPEAHNNLGECLLALDEFERAELHFRRALQQQPRPEIYNNLALAAIRRNEHRDAVRHLEQALTSAESIDPAVELAIHYNFARALTALGQPRDSIIYHARRALALAGDGPLTTSRAEEIAWLREVLEGGAE